MFLIQYLLIVHIYFFWRGSEIVCNILRKGVAAVFGPQSSSAARHIQSICDTMEIPHLETRRYKMNRGSCLVNLFPHPQALSEVNQILLL